MNATKDGECYDMGYLQTFVKFAIMDGFVYILKATDGSEVVLGEKDYQLLKKLINNPERLN